MAYLAKLTLAKFPFDKLLAASSLALGLSLGPSALAGSAAPGTPAPPPQKGVNIGSGPKAPATDEPVARLQMTADLLAVGRDSKDPLALVVAMACSMQTSAGKHLSFREERADDVSRDFAGVGAGSVKGSTLG